MPERKTLNRTYSVGDQVPTCPVFTRAKIKSRFGILVDLPSPQRKCQGDKRVAGNIDAIKINKNEKGLEALRSTTAQI